MFVKTRTHFRPCLRLSKRCETTAKFTPLVARKIPFYVDLKVDQEYLWCACGKSKNQPFCDGSHKGTGIMPVKFKVDTPGRKRLCACKRTSNAPYCDFTHVNVIMRGLIGQSVPVPPRDKKE